MAPSAEGIYNGGIMSEPRLDKNSLVLYKQKAARILDSGSKRITIQLMDGKQVRVRPKDVILLHPGPIGSLLELDMQSEDNGDLLAAWELLAGGETNLRDLVELAYGEFTPPATWAAWKMVADGMYFNGSPDLITAFTAEHVQQENTKRAAREEVQR